jgi:hypothetical protein
VVLGTYRDLFIAIAGAGAALTGLLFVAMSVAPRPRIARTPDVIRQVRAASSLLSFTNALSVTLFGLVPGNRVGYPAVVLGIIGIVFTAAGIRSIVANPSVRPALRGQIGLVVVLLLAFGFELGAGVVLIKDPRSTTPMDVLSNVLVGSLIIGVGRAWELVSDRDTSLFSSIAVLAGREARPDDLPAELADSARPDTPTGRHAGTALPRDVP